MSCVKPKVNGELFEIANAVKLCHVHNITEVTIIILQKSSSCFNPSNRPIQSFWYEDVSNLHSKRDID